MPVDLVLSCEHATPLVPAGHRAWFVDAGDALTSHEAYDAGALVVARALARHFAVTVTATRVTRLLVDTNRSARNPAVFSRFSRRLPAPQRAALLRRFHEPHREQVRARCRRSIAAGHTVIHIGVHSFTPVLQGTVRRCDIGLLYDPARPAEARLCARWKREVQRRAPTLRVRRNYPYRGSSDGLTRTLRQEFAAADYRGIEVELNQNLPGILAPAATPWFAALAGSLDAVLAG